MFNMHIISEIFYVYASLIYVASFNALEEEEGSDPSGLTSNVEPPGILPKPNFTNFHSFLA